MDSILNVSDIRKTYGKYLVLDSLSFDIKAGEILGLLGENGAGKSTIISILTGIKETDSGRIEYKGLDIKQNSKLYKADLGYVPQEIALFLDLSTKENLWFWAKSYKMCRELANERIDKIIELFALENVCNRRVRDLSGGYQRRINIASALLHEPKILFLDEPTVGIDVSVRLEILKIVKSLADSGVGILYTSHYIDELEEISDRVLIMREGKKMALLEKSDYNEESLEKIYLNLCKN